TTAGTRVKTVSESYYFQYKEVTATQVEEVTENGATFSRTQVVDGVITVMPITTADEKSRRRLELKARSTLMMGIPNEHKLKFNSIKDAKQLLKAVENRFSRNATTKKTQRNLLKQQFKDFSASSSEMLDQTFDRFQKLVSQLELLDETLTQDDVNQKILRSLSPEWNTHVVVWRNKADLDTLSMYDLYNKLKKTRRKLTVNGNETLGFDMSKVECYNCHKKRHFAKECRAPRTQNNKHKESTRKSVPVKTPASTSLVPCDGLGGYDWSDQAEEEPNYALMAYTSSSSDSKVLQVEIQMKDIAIGELRRKVKVAQKEENGIQLKIYFMPPELDLSFTGLDEFFNKPKVENNHVKSSAEETKVVRKDTNAPIIKEWVSDNEKEIGNLQIDLQDQRVIDSGCSRHMIGNMSYLTNYEEIDEGYVAFGGNPKRGKIIRKAEATRTMLADYSRFTWVFFLATKDETSARTPQQKGVVERRNKTLFEAARTMLADSKLPTTFWAEVVNTACYIIDESQVLLRVPRKNNMYSIDLKNIVPKGGLTCLFEKVTSNESKLWHRRLGHLNFKTMNKLVKINLVRGLPYKLFENDQNCVACQKGKQHRASCKTKTENSISLPLHLLHMHLFGPKLVKSLMKKMHCLVVTDDYSRFTCVFFLATKDETSGILKSIITRIENLVDHKVKVIRCDNGSEFKNSEMNQFCEMKGILRQFSVARTPQQNRVAERKNRTLIEDARTMLADFKLPTTFWAEAVNIACYVQNRVLVVKPHNKTPYELFHGRTPTLSFMRPFGCPVTILNTKDHSGKFDGKADEGFFVGYFFNSKAFRVFNSRTRIMEENLHIRFTENTPNVIGSEPDWLFDIDTLTRTMNYEPITADPPFSQEPKSSYKSRFKPLSDDGKKVDEDPSKENECKDQEKEDNVNNTNNVNTVSLIVNPASTSELPFDPNMPALEDLSIFNFSRNDKDDDAMADMNNLDTTIQVSPYLTIRIHKYHHFDQVIRDLHSTTQTRQMLKNLKEHGFISTIQQRTNHKDLQNCLFACFLSQEKPKKVIHALKDPNWIEAMQKELLQFKLQEVWTLVDLLNGKRAIGSNWVFKNKKNERGIMIRKKARLVAQGYTQEKGIDYDEVFAPVARIKAIRLFLAYASFKDFVVYQIDVKSVFLYEKIKEEVYVEDQDFPDRVYKVEKALYGLHQAPRACKTASTPMETQKPMLKDEDGKEVDVHMIGSLMYLTSSRPDIMFVVCACARYQVNPKVSHLYAVKRIFRVGKGFSGKVTPLFQTMVQQLGEDEVVHKELDDRLVRAATTASSLEAKQDSGGGTRYQETMRDIITQTSQQDEIASLKRRVKKLEKRNRSRTHGLKRLYKVGLSTRVESSGDEESLGDDASKQGRRINAIDADEDNTLVSAADNEMFDVDVLEVFVAEKNENVVEEVVDAAQVSTVATIVIITTKEITLAQVLEALKTSKPKVKGIVFQEPEEPVKPKKKDQIRLDEEIAKKLQAEFDEEERLAREKDEKEERSNIALIEEWDDIQAKIDADHQLALRLQAQEQEELSIAEKATLFQQLLEKRRKYFAAKRAEEKKKPPTKSQHRKIMCTYLKNMEGYKLKDLKLKEFDSIQEMFDKAFKKQKVEDDKETVELEQLMETIPDEEKVAIDAIPLAVKSSRIVDWKIHKEGKKNYYQTVRADERSQMYMIFS
nr:putative ribonuclease H-like domain-containing protein [Tanacetum cinerariifolium]